MSLKIAVIGCGNIANHVHMPSILKYQKKYGNLQIAACADKDEAKAQAFAAKYGIEQYFSDYHAMLDAVKPAAAVCLVSETVIHNVAADIINAGIPVLMEKPPGRSKDELNHIITAANTHKDLKIIVAFNRRFAPVYTKLKDLCRTKKMRHIVYGMHRINRYESYFETTAIHAVDAVKWLAGSDYKKIRIDYQDMPEKGEKVANYYIFAEFANGVTAQINILVSTGRLCEGCQIFCDDSIYYADYISDKSEDYGIREYSNNRLAGVIPRCELCEDEYIELMGFYDEHKAFYDSLLKNTQLDSGSLTSSAQSVDICDALKRRIKSFEW